VPGVLKVNEKFCPGFNTPESQTPVSEVAVWAIESVFTQVTVVPAAITRGLVP
jgi:hypothetical protein